MNQRIAAWTAEWALRCMGACAVLIFALLPVHAFISTWGGTAIGPLAVWKSWKEILLAALLPLVIAYFIVRPDSAKRLWARPINKLIALYVLLHGVLTIGTLVSPEATVAGLLMNVRFFAMFLLAQLLADSDHTWVARFKSVLPRWLLWTAIGLGIVALLQVLVLPKDFLAGFGYTKDTIAPYVLVDDNPNALRAFATLRGPNTLGAFLLLPLGVALYCLCRRKLVGLSAAAFGFGMVALALTGSRSAWLGTLVMMGVIGALLLPRAQLVRWARRMWIPAIMAVIGVVWLSITVPAVRLAVFHSSPEDPYLLEGSSEAHGQAAIAGAADAFSQPLGQGPGAAGPASFYAATPKISENYYIQLAQELGFLGLGLFVAICVLVIRELRRRKGMMPCVLLASFAGLSLINLFLHGWADDPTAMTWWGLAGLYIGTRERGKGT